MTTPQLSVAFRDGKSSGRIHTVILRRYKRCFNRATINDRFETRFHGVDTARAVLEHAVGEAACRRAGVETDLAGKIDRETAQAWSSLSPPRLAERAD
jgi:hypothetical protein